MTAALSFLAQLWSALGASMQLRGDAFLAATRFPDAVWVAVGVVFVAGLSEAFGQCIVLFASRVKPARFVLSLLTDALLFAFGYAFLVGSTWLVTRLPWAVHVSLRDLAIAIALSYAPLLFSFLTALPYLGSGLLRVLHIWHLLALLIGIAAVAGVDVFTAMTYVWLGWLVTLIARHTFGKPIVAAGARLLDAAAGTQVVDDVDPARLAEAPSPRSPSEPAAPGNGPLGTIGALCAMALLTFLVALALEPARNALLGWQQHLPAILRLPFDLIWLGVVAVVVAAAIAPLETLGWWAGWYGDGLAAADPPAQDSPTAPAFERYVVYLDGIQQSNLAYTADVETFLDALGPALGAKVALVRGIMAYSVLNRPLEDDPLWSRFWKFVEGRRNQNINSALGWFINLRNVLIVAVSADSRYGPMYNFGIADVVYRSLLARGYRPRSGVPVSLIGYSGGGQMACGSAEFLRRAIDAPVDVISLGGVISGNDRILGLEHVSHFVGDKDNVEKVGPLMFASRWPIAWLSYWNRAKRLGVLTQTSLGPVGHQVPGGMFDPNQKLPDGRTFLAQTIDRIVQVVSGRVVSDMPAVLAPTNYAGYAAATGGRWLDLARRTIPEPARARYRPVADWIGRLALPELGERFGGAWFDVFHAPPEAAALVGRRVKLQWLNRPDVRDRLRALRHDVNFSPEARAAGVSGGLVVPVRLDRRRFVDPLESLAGARPFDDAIVKLVGTVEVVAGDTALRIEREPVQITGSAYGVVRFERSDGDGAYLVRHFDARSRTFDGPEERVTLPGIAADLAGRPNSLAHGLESAPLNAGGWYAYGGFDADETFAVQALAPRQLLAANAAMHELPNGIAARRYVRKKAWPETVAHRGSATSVALGSWRASDLGLLVHTYGGIGGPHRERASSFPIYFGHFAYGIVEAVDEPLTGELRLDLTYYQVYTQNTDGITAGALDWSRYLGDRQYGWSGIRPVCEAIVRHDALTAQIETSDGRRIAAIEALRAQLETMAARYRIGDGTGATFVGAANNCSQDSNRALFATLEKLHATQSSNPQFAQLARALRSKLLLFGRPRRDWSANEFDLGSSIEDAPLQNFITALGSWRCILPRVAFHTVVTTFLEHGAQAAILGGCYLGGDRHDVDPVTPTGW